MSKSIWEDLLTIEHGKIIMVGGRGTCKQEIWESVPVVTPGCLQQAHSQLKAFYQQTRLICFKKDLFTSTRSQQLVTPNGSKHTVTEQIVWSQTAEELTAKHNKRWRIMWWNDHGLVDPISRCYVFSFKYTTNVFNRARLMCVMANNNILSHIFKRYFNINIEHFW